MNKIHAFVLALLITLTIANLLFISSSPQSQRETAFVSRIIDGDTIELEDSRVIRLLNINAPEKDTSLSSLSIEFLSLLQGRQIELEITGTEKYGRLLARIYAPDYVNLEIIKKGLGSKFLVDSSELSDFSKAERYAVENGLGIWSHSSFYNCISSKVDAKSEFVELKNFCPEINMSGWQLKDESRKTYKFHSVIKSGLRLYSSYGQDSETEVYWNSGNVWNNDRDTLYLFDSENNLVSYYSYGY